MDDQKALSAQAIGMWGDASLMDRIGDTLAIAGLLIALIFIGGPVDKDRLRTLRHHHRAHN